MRKDEVLIVGAGPVGLTFEEAVTILKRRISEEVQFSEPADIGPFIIHVGMIQSPPDPKGVETYLKKVFKTL